MGREKGSRRRKNIPRLLREQRETLSAKIAAKGRKKRICPDGFDAGKRA